MFARLDSRHMIVAQALIGCDFSAMLVASVLSLKLVHSIEPGGQVRTGALQALRAVPVGQAQNAQGEAVAMLRVRLGADHVFDQCADRSSPVDQARGLPLEVVGTVSFVDGQRRISTEELVYA